MKLFTRIIPCLILASTILFGCATQIPKISDTPWPQTVLPAISKEETKERFMRLLASNGGVLVDENPSSLKFYAPLSGNSAMMTNLFVGSSYSEPPRDYVHFILSSTKEGTFVLVQFWREVQQYNGTWNRIELQNNSQTYNQIQQMLNDAKAAAEKEGGLK